MAHLKRAQQVDDLRLHRHVEGRGRLVENHELRFEHDGARDGDALALSAREFMRVSIYGGGIKPRLLQSGGDDGAPFDGVQILAREGKSLAHDVDDRQARGQRSVRVLEDDLHAATKRAHAGKPEGVDRFAEVGDPTLRGDQAQDRKPERGLARPRFADDADGLALRERRG